MSVEACFYKIFNKDLQDLLRAGETCFFGEFLGKGSYTGAIRLNEETLSFIKEDIASFKEPVLIISTEVEKPTILESVTGFSNFFLTKEEKYKDNNIIQYLKELETEFKVNIFITERFTDFYINNRLVEICEQFLEQEIPPICQISNFLDLDEEKWAVSKEYEDKIFKTFYSKENREEALKIWQIIVRDLKKMAKALLDKFGDLEVLIDLHDEQFGIVKGETVLIDGFIIQN